MNNECVFENDFFDQFKVLDYVSNTDICINKCNIRILSVHAIDWSSKVESKRHKHSFFELHYILEGNVFLDIDGDVAEVGSKHFYLLKPGIMHYEYQNESNSHKGVVLRWEYVDEVQGDNAKYSCMELGNIKRILYNSNNKPVMDDGTIY